VQWFYSELPASLQTFDELKNFHLIIRNFNRVTNSMKRSPYWEADSRSDSQNTLPPWTEPEGSYHGHKSPPPAPNRTFFIFFLLFCAGTKTTPYSRHLAFRSDNIALFSCGRATSSDDCRIQERNM
jgi:hypothetical protein